MQASLARTESYLISAGTGTGLSYASTTRGESDLSDSWVRMPSMTESMPPGSEGSA